LPCVLPEVEGDEPELEEPELEDPELDEPGFGVVEPGVPAVPGKVPHGEPLGVVPGVLLVLGFTVEGCVLLPGVAGLVEFEPGTPEFGVVEPVGGGVVVLVGGAWVVLVGGVAAPGACDCPAAPELPAGAAPPAGAVCATIQLAQRRSMERKPIFLGDIIMTPSLEFFASGNPYISSVSARIRTKPIGPMP
jgi:hypothetical protein